jgi:hypothetical protein
MLNENLINEGAVVSATKLADTWMADVVGMVTIELAFMSSTSDDEILIKQLADVKHKGGTCLMPLPSMMDNVTTTIVTDDRTYVVTNEDPNTSVPPGVTR